MNEADKTARPDPLADADTTLNALRASGAINEAAEARFRSALDKKRKPAINVDPLVQVGSKRLGELRGLVTGSDDSGLTPEDLEALGSAIEVTQQAESSGTQPATLDNRGRGRRRFIYTVSGVLALGLVALALNARNQSNDLGPGTGETSQDRAMAIFGEDFLGAAAVQNTFGVVIPAETIPPIPFSQSDLERARDLGQFLILRTTRASDGQLLTMDKMAQIVGPAFRANTRGNIVQDFASGQTKDQFCLIKEVPRASSFWERPIWALVTKEILPGSLSSSYYDTTKLIAAYIRADVFKEKPIPAQYTQALREFDEAQVKGKLSFPLTRTYGWGSAQKEESYVLSTLKLNQLTRHTPVEALYDCLVYYCNNNVKLLRNVKTWTIGLTKRVNNYSNWLNNWELELHGDHGITISFGNYTNNLDDFMNWRVDESRPDMSSHIGVLFSRRA